MSLPEQIAEHLGHLILAGQYRPGDRLKEQEIAGQFSVSRGPVRDALHMLEKRGFVEILPRRGAHVVNMGIDEVIDIFNIRAALLGLTARLAAGSGATDIFDTLAQRVKQMKRLASATDTSALEYAAASRENQQLLAEAAGNRRLAVMLDELNNRGLWRMIWRDAPFDHDTVAGRQQSVQIWSRLVAAVRRGDAVAADDCGKELILASRDRILARIGKSAH